MIFFTYHVRDLHPKRGFFVLDQQLLTQASSSAAADPPKILFHFVGKNGRYA